MKEDGLQRRDISKDEYDLQVNNSNVVKAAVCL